jgi:transcriptional regulator with XRE-family HTH domain
LKTSKSRLTQQQLADKAEIEKAYITMIESGNRKGPLTTIKRIAKALAIGLDMIA